MAFAWWALHEHAVFSEMMLADSPDIRAVMPRPVTNGGVEETVTVRGDIGRCSPLAVLQGLNNLCNIHDIWLSVLDWRTHVVVEFNYSPSSYLSYKRSPECPPDVALRKIFFCETCGAWTIDQDSRERTLEIWRKRQG